MLKLVLGTVCDNLTAGGPIHPGTMMVATWALGDEGVDENGKTITINNPLVGELLSLVAAQKSGHEMTFISHEGVFRDLATNERPRHIFVEELEALRRQGVRAHLYVLAGRIWAA